MSRASNWISIILLLAVGVGLVYVGWNMMGSRSAQACSACGRPIHRPMHTIGVADGRRQVFCCPTCALTLHRQTGRLVEVVELTDYDTSEPLSPDDAYLVTESNVNLCMRHHVLMDDHKEASAMEFDRCAPSMIAFGSRERAERFQREHGGVVLPFQQVAKAYQAPAAP